MNELIVASRLENLAKIADFVTTATHQAGLSDRAAYGVQMAVDEACTNVIEHAYGNQNNGDIRITYQLEATCLRLIITDKGTPFDPSIVAKPDPNAPLEARSSRGMGMFLMRNLVDEIEYQFQTPQGNQLIMVKYRE